MYAPQPDEWATGIVHALSIYLILYAISNFVLHYIFLIAHKFDLLSFVTILLLHDYAASLA